MKNYNQLNKDMPLTKKNKNNYSSTSLTEDDGQSKKLEEKIVTNKTGSKSAFSKDVNLSLIHI